MAPERRLHARLSLDLACSIGSAGIHGRLRELSLGGALVEAPPDCLAVKARCVLAVEVPGWPGPFLVKGRVVRREFRPRANVATFGVRLDAADDPILREQLAAVVDMLFHAPGPGTRRHVRMHWRADLVCRSVREFAALLANVSLGGLALTSEREVALGEKLTVEIRVKGQPPMVFPSTVVHVNEEEPSRWNVGVRFEELAPEARDRLAEFLRRTLRRGPEETG